MHIYNADSKDFDLLLWMSRELLLSAIHDSNLYVYFTFSINNVSEGFKDKLPTHWLFN